MDRRILSYPVKLHMAGWESDTFRLQQAGWQISAQQDVDQSSMRLAIKHEGLRMRAVTNYIQWDYYAAFNRYGAGMPAFPVVHFDIVGRSIMVDRPSQVMWGPIDAQPMLVDRRLEEIDDFVHFAPAPLTRTRQLILPEATIPDLMDRILELQQPIREEHFKQQANDAIRYQKFHCQILSEAA